MFVIGYHFCACMWCVYGGVVLDLRLGFYLVSIHDLLLDFIQFFQLVFVSTVPFVYGFNTVRPVVGTSRVLYSLVLQYSRQRPRQLSGG